MQPARSRAAAPSLVDGRYAIEGVLGEGGSARVLRARHILLGHAVALKFLRPSAREERARLLQEAQTLARMRSPHTVRVYDYGTTAEGPYLAMELVEGVRLSDAIDERGAFSVRDAADRLLEACDALAEAHSLGLVHRDLKPENMLLTAGPDGEVLKVLDFGMAKTEARLTATHAFMGTPLYMSPEQTFSAREVDARTDVWALGVILYELLTGRRPFDGANLVEVLHAVREHPHVPVRALAPAVPPRLAALVDACLAKRAAERVASVRDLALCLAPFGSPRTAALAARVGGPASSPPSSAPPRSMQRPIGPRMRSRRRLLIAAAAVVGAFAGGAFTALLAAPPTSIPPATATPAAAEDGAAAPKPAPRPQSLATPSRS